MTKTEELKTVLNCVRQTLEQCQAENERLIRMGRYYGETDWRLISMADRGEFARKTIQSIMGVCDERNTV